MSQVRLEEWYRFRQD